MSFLQPGMLWFLFLLLPLLAVYLLKVRPVRRQTTTFFFWDQILKQKKASALFRRLRDILSLLLLAAALCALVGAMAKPSFVSKENQKDLLILIDNSASMAASPGNKSRLSEARQIAAQLIRAMPMDRRAMLVSVAAELRPLVNLTSNQRTLMEGLELLDQSDLPFRPQALDSLRRSREVREKSRIILISDGCFTGSEALEGIELLKIGKPCPNLGIVGFDLSRVPGANDSLEFYFQLISSFKEPKDVDVLLCRETPDNVVKVCPVTVQPGENPPEIFSIEPGPSGRWLLILDIKDSLDKDNIAYAVVPEVKPIRVAVQADDSGFFFAQCVKAFSEAAGVMTLAQDQPEVLLSSGQPIDTQAASLHIIFKPTGSSPFWQSLGSTRDPQPARSKLPEHPAIRFCDVEAVNFAGQTKITPPPGSLILAETHDGLPLIYKTTQDQKTAYVLNMDPEEAEFFLSAYFPVIVYSMARDLTGTGVEHPASIQVGSFVSIGQTDSSQPVRVTDPAALLSEYPDGRIGPLDTLGFYHVQTDRESKTLACSLLSPQESFLDNSLPLDTTNPLPRGWPPAYILIVIALFIAAAESVLYHRRKVG